MRSILVLLLVACAFVCTLANPETAVPPTPAAAAPVATPATPAASPESVAAVQASVNDLDGRVQQITQSVTDLKTSVTQTATQVTSLASSVTDGLKKLNAADETQTASATSVASRLDALEREVSEIKKLVATVAANSQPQTKQGADPVLAEILSNQALILERLANATAAWSFDHEAILAQIKHSSYTYSAQLSKFLQRWATNIQTQYPHVLARATEYSQVGLEQAQQYGAQAQILSGDAHFFLSEQLQKNGVPKEFVHYAALSILGLIGLVAFLIFWSLLKAICRCFCCRSKASKKDKKLAKKSE